MNIPMVEILVRKAAKSVDNARDLMSKLERPPGDDPEPYDFTQVRDAVEELKIALVRFEADLSGR